MPASSQGPVVGPSTPAPSPEYSPESGRRFTKTASIRIVKDQLKVAEARSNVASKEAFVFYSDEPPALGGEDKFPQPLSYISAGVGF